MLFKADVTFSVDAVLVVDATAAVVELVELLPQLPAQPESTALPIRKKKRKFI